MNKLFLYIVNDATVGVSLAGLTPVEWLIRGAGEIPYRVISAEEEATAAEGYRYMAILYPSTPLATADILLDLIKEMGKRGIEGLEIGRGKLLTVAAFYKGAFPKRRAAHAALTEITTPRGWSEAERILYRRIAEKSAQNGAIIPDVDNVRIDARTLLSEGAVVEPYTQIRGSVVGMGARIGCFSEIENAEIGAGAEISRSVVRDSVIEEGATVGPFAYIRMQSRIGAGCRVGDFVEIKKSALGAGTKAAHLAYVGDAKVGAHTNVGCGTVFANYDGKEKHGSVVGERVFLGANTNLVAPVTIGNDAYIAAATTVTEDVPEGALVIGRVRAQNKERKGG